MVNLALGSSTIAQQRDSLNTLSDLFARRLSLWLALAISDCRLFRLHPDSIPSRFSMLQYEKIRAAGYVCVASPLITGQDQPEASEKRSVTGRLLSQNANMSRAGIAVA
jgi:hypothetical protein